jgi:N-succinyldiaminopimelate aminotransferase
MPTTSNRVAPYGTTIFAEINQLAAQHNAINLGQGRPDFDGPPDIIAAAVTALHDGRFNQYPPMPGSVAMRGAIANHAGAFYGLDVDPNGGVIITAGATEAIFSSVLGLVDPGDEVILIEPFFDSYVPNLTFAGAKPVYVPLRLPGWTLDPAELRAAFSEKTRALIWNSPQNPTGRVFSREEMMLVADLCKEFDVTVISDEVYEHLTFGDSRHIPIATLPGMFERTVTVSSLGKSYSVTGWKIGWVYGPNNLISGVQRAHQFVTYAVMGPAQEAGAYALAQPGTYYEELQAMYSSKRDILMDGLKAAGFKFMAPEGTYFIMADFSDLYDGDAVSFARYLTTEIGVGCIPPAPFYSDSNRYIGDNWARFAFCKSDDTLRAANERLLQLKNER